jgi:hypothetical protein
LLFKWNPRFMLSNNLIPPSSHEFNGGIFLPKRIVFEVSDVLPTVQ